MRQYLEREKLEILLPVNGDHEFSDGITF